MKETTMKNTRVRPVVWWLLAAVAALVIIGSLIIGDPRPTGAMARQAAARVKADR
jgi:hypothetical protein